MTVGNAAAVCLFCAAAVTVKFSGLLLGPIAAGVIGSRALLKTPWPCFGWTLHGKPRKFAAAVGLCLAAAMVSYVGVWACYGFRFSATPDPNGRISLAPLLAYTAKNDLIAKHHAIPTTQEILDWTPGVHRQNHREPGPPSHPSLGLDRRAALHVSKAALGVKPSSWAIILAPDGGTTSPWRCSTNRP